MCTRGYIFSKANSSQIQPFKLWKNSHSSSSDSKYCTGRRWIYWMSAKAAYPPSPTSSHHKPEAEEKTVTSGHLPFNLTPKIHPANSHVCCYSQNLASSRKLNIHIFWFSPSPCIFPVYLRNTDCAYLWFFKLSLTNSHIWVLHLLGATTQIL